MGVPDYLKDHHEVQGKLAILEQHQIKLRKNYLTATTNNGLSPEGISLKKGVKELGNNAASTLATLGNEETSDHETREPFINSNSKHIYNQCGCEEEPNKLSAIEVSIAKILELMEDNILKEQRRAEWSMLGALIDRILLIILIIAASTTTLYIYVLAPVSYT